MLNSLVESFEKQQALSFKGAPKVPGVYALVHKGEIVYIGESKNLADRVSHHLHKNGSCLLDKISSTVRNTDEYLEQCSMKFLEVNFGRLELEEFLIEKYKPLFNNFYRRKLKKRKN